MADLGGLVVTVSMVDDSFAAGARRMTDQLRRLEQQSGHSFRQVGASAERATRQFRGSIGNLGQQLQDVVVQFQSGTNASIIFAQQFPQMVSAINPAYSALGALAAIAAVGAGALFGLSRDVEIAKETTKAFEAATKLTASTVAASVKDINDLADAYLGLNEAQRRVEELQLGRGVRAQEANAAAARALIEEQLASVDIALRRAGGAPIRGAEGRAEVVGPFIEAIEQFRAGGGAAEFIRSVDDARRALDETRASSSGASDDLTRLAETVSKVFTRDVDEQFLELSRAEDKAAEAARKLQLELDVLANPGPFKKEAQDQLKGLAASYAGIGDEIRAAARRDQDEREREAARLDREAKAARERKDALDKAESDRIARDALARKERVDAFQLEVAQSQRLADAIGINTAKYEAEKAAIDAENAVRRLGIDLSTDMGKALLEEAKRREENLQRIKDSTEADRERQREADRQQREIERQAEETQRLLNRPFEDFLSSVRSSTASVFQDIYSGGVKTFSDLFATASQLAVRFAAELSALAVFRPGLVFGGAQAAAGAPTAAGGAAATAASLNPFGPLGFFGGGLGTLGSAFPSVFGNSPALASGAGFGAGGIPTGSPLAAFGGVSIGGLLASGGLGFAAGSALGPLLGLNQTGSGLGGGAGAALGFLLTGGNPLGALAGGTLGGVGGGLLGNLFSKKGDDNAQAQIDLATGRLTAVNTNSDPRNLSQTQAIGAELVTLRQTLGALGASFDAFSIEVKAGNKSGFTLRTPGGAAGTQEFGSAEELQAAALRLLAGSARGGLSAAERQAVERTDATDAAGFAEALRVARAFEELTGDITPLGREIRALGDAFNSQREAFAKLGFSTEALIAAQERGVAGIREQAAAQISAQYDPTIQAIQGARQQIAFQNTSPIGQFQLAREEFERIRRGAAAGNVEAIGQLPAVATAFSAVVRDVFGTSGRAGGFQERIDATLAANQNLLQTLKEREERALGAVDSQTKTIIELHRESIVEWREMKRLLAEMLLRQKTAA